VPEDWPETLEQAHMWLDACNPGPDASLLEQERFQDLSADVYAHVAVTDPAHKDWARQWGVAAREKATQLHARIAVRKALVFYLGPDFDAQT
jgi:hypothetical protein